MTDEMQSRDKMLRGLQLDAKAEAEIKQLIADTDDHYEKGLISKREWINKIAELKARLKDSK